MSICDDSQLTAQQFYDSLISIYNNRNYWSLIPTIKDYCYYIVTSFGMNSGTGFLHSQASTWLACLVRCLFASIAYIPVLLMGILLSFFYNHLCWGSVYLSDCRKSTGKQYKLSITFYSGMCWSRANLHFSHEWTITDLSELPESLYSITLTGDTSDDAGIQSGYNDDMGFDVIFNISDFDLKKFFDFTEEEVEYNLVDLLISVFKKSDDNVNPQ